ncbi:hypothetical protein HDU98_005976 [Podochytrium sp. JEL0797]|nr:hypothetical protein HDU98_005976 [Podochytrium sp. JEL0797]
MFIATDTKDSAMSLATPPGPLPHPFLSPRLRASHHAAHHHSSRSRGTSSSSQYGSSFGNHQGGGSIDRDSIMAMALYSRSPLLASSPSRDLAHFAGLTDDFCKDFVCCGINMDNLHDLLQHFEEFHVSANDDNDSDSDPGLADLATDASALPVDQPPPSIWNSYGRSRSFGGDDKLSNEKSAFTPPVGTIPPTAVVEQNYHLPFAFESHVASPESSNLPYSVVAAAPATPASSSKPGSIPNSLSFASRGRSFMNPNNPSSSATSTSAFASNVLSSSLGALSVNPPTPSPAPTSTTSTTNTTPTSRPATAAGAGAFSNMSGSLLSASQANARVNNSNSNHISTVPSSPSTSTHSMTPPPLHHELIPGESDAQGGESFVSTHATTTTTSRAKLSYAEVAARKRREEGGGMTPVDSIMSDSSDADTNAGESSRKRKVADDRMEVDEVVVAGGTCLPVEQPQQQPFNSPMRLDSVSSCLSETESVSNKKRSTMGGVAAVGGGDFSADPQQFVMDQEDDDEESSWITVNGGLGGSAGDVRGGNGVGGSAGVPAIPLPNTRMALSHFKKRSLLSSASFSPTSTPEPDASMNAILAAAAAGGVLVEQLPPPQQASPQQQQQPQQPHVKFSEMSAESIEAFQRMTPQEQQEFIMSNLEPNQIALLMMMVNQASLSAPVVGGGEATGSGAGTPVPSASTLVDSSSASLSPTGSTASTTTPVQPPTGKKGASLSVKTKSSANASTAAATSASIKAAKGKPKLTQKIALNQKQQKDLLQERTPSASSTSPTTATGSSATTTRRASAAAAAKKGAAAASAGEGESPTPADETEENGPATTVTTDADRPFKCHLCEKTYKNPGGIKYHLKHTHGIEHISFSDMSDANRPYLCTAVEGCGKRYKNLNGLKYHIEHAHVALLEGTVEVNTEK